jgi:hypothetical protein
LAAPASIATIILTPTADSYAVLNTPASNFGSAADLHVESYPLDGPNFTRSLMQFSMADLAYQLPVGATVLTATLKLHLTQDALLTETLTVHTGSGPTGPRTRLTGIINPRGSRPPRRSA